MGGSKRRIRKTESRELARLLAPVTEEDFASRWFGARPLHVRGSKDKFRELFSRERFDRAIDRAGHLAATFTSRHAIDVKPQDVPELYSSGATICATDIERGDRALERWALAIKTQLGHAGRVSVRAYLSPDDAGFDLHFDSVVATILQIEGRKRWRYAKEPALTFPLFNAGPNEDGALQYYRPSGRPERSWEKFSPPDGTTFEEVVLSPGDLLCLPAGYWHTARAIGHSLALNLSFVTVPFWELLAHAVEPVLTANERWRAPSPPAVAGDETGDTPAHVRAFFEDRIRELRALLDRPDVLDLHLGHAWRRAVLTGHHELDHRSEAASVRPTDRLRTNKHTPIRIGFGPTREGARALFVGFAPSGSDLAFPLSTLPFFRVLAQKNRFIAKSASSWDDRPWRETRKILERLLQHGIVERD